MLADADDDVEIARRSAMRPGISFACDADTLAVTRAGLDAYFQWFGAGYHSCAPACRTAFLRLSGTSAFRAGHIEFHAPGSLSRLAAATTIATGFRFSNQALAAAVRTGILARDVQPHDRTPDGIPETDVYLVFEIAAMVRLGVHLCAAAAEHAGKNVFEPASASAGAAGFGKIEPAEVKGDALRAPTSRERTGAETACAKASAARISFGGGRVNVVRIKAELVIDLALLRIAENVIGLGNLFEFVLGFVAGIHVRMVFSGELTKSFADLLL